MSQNVDQSGNLNVSSLSVNDHQTIYSYNEYPNIKHHNLHTCVHKNNNTNTTVRAEHMSSCRICAKDIFTSSLTSATINSDEYRVNNKIAIDKSKNFYAKSIKIDNDVTLTSNGNGNLLINDVNIYDKDTLQNYPNVDENKFCQQWKTPYIGKGIITGYVTSVSSNGLYQTITDSAGNISVSSDYGYSFSTMTNLTNGGSLATVAMSDDGQYQLTVDFVGNVYQSENFGKTWHKKAMFAIYDSMYIDYFSISISQSGKY